MRPRDLWLLEVAALLAAEGEGEARSEPAPEPPPAPAERRRSRRVPLQLEIAAPVLVRSDLSVQRGLARNISEGGMLIELAPLPAIGTRLDVSFAGISGSKDAPESVVLRGEVRHQLSWQYSTSAGKRVLRAVGVRFIEAKDEPRAPLTSWIWATGYTVH